MNEYAERSAPDKPLETHRSRTPSATTIMTAEEAPDYGLIDEVIAPSR